MHTRKVNRDSSFVSNSYKPIGENFSFGEDVLDDCLKCGAKFYEDCNQVKHCLKTHYWAFVGKNWDCPICLWGAFGNDYEKTWLSGKPVGIS